MISKVLLVIPNEKTKAKIEQFLVENGFEVDSATNGKEAQIKIYKNRFAAVILDLDTQDYPGTQVLRYIKVNFSTLKVVVTAQSKEKFEELNLDPKQIRKLGASDIFVEPIPLKLLMKALAGNRQANTEANGATPQVGPSKEQEFRHPDTKYTRIPIDEFFTQTTTACGIFLRLEKNSYLRILTRGEAYDRERVERHKKEKNADHFYIMVEDRLLYITAITSALEGIIKTPTVTTSKKLLIFKTLIEQFTQEVYTNGIKPQLVEEGKKISLCLGLFTTTEKNLGAAMKALEKFPDSPYTHLYLTTLFTATMARNVSWVSGSSLPNALMGAMFHDIGLIKIHPKIAYKSHDKMTPAEWEEFKKHPLIGRDMLSTCSTVVEPIRQIVNHHHEFADSSGFPGGLSDAKIYPPAKIVSLANYYVDFFIEQELTPLMGLQKLVSTPEHVKKFNPEIIKALVSSFTR